MDANATPTNVVRADAEVVWSWHPDADAKLARDDLAGDGGKKARAPGRARRKPLKPSRRECRMIWLNLVWGVRCQEGVVSWWRSFARKCDVVKAGRRPPPEAARQRP